MAGGGIDRSLSGLCGRIDSLLSGKFVKVLIVRYEVTLRPPMQYLSGMSSSLFLVSSVSFLELFLLFSILCFYSFLFSLNIFS